MTGFLATTVLVLFAVTVTRLLITGVVHVVLAVSPEGSRPGGLPRRLRAARKLPRGRTSTEA
jgi:hypothetical protein